MKKIYLFICIMAVGVMGMAQSNDPEAKVILDAVSAKFKTFKTIQAGFNYKVENGAGKALSTKTGSILVKGTKYKVNFSGQDIYCNGVMVWNYDKSSNEVTISKLDESNSMITKLFTNFYDKDYLYKLNGEQKSGGHTLQEIEMTPVDKSKSFHKVYLEVDKNAHTIYSTKVLENAGNRYSYTITSMKNNTLLDDKLFVFDKTKYPGVQEVDLR